MNEKQTPATEIVRPTKKQRELLSFIDEFIREHGYSPSYREIMAGLSYTSVATVSLHVNNLIKRGHLRRRDRSARSLEVINSDATPSLTTNQVTPTEEKWLIDKVEHVFVQAEQTGEVLAATLADLESLIAALRILGLDGAAQSFVPRLNPLKQRLTNGAI